MSVVDGYRKSSIGSHLTSFFLNVPTDLKTPETKAFHLAFIRNEAATIETGAESETIADVTQKVQPTELKSFAPTQAFSGVYLKDDPVCKYLLDLYDRRAVGGDVYCEHLEVRRWDNNKAIKSTVSVIVESITHEAGNQTMIAGTYGFVSDPIEGTATIAEDTGIATFTAKGDGGTEASLMREKGSGYSTEI